MEVEIDLPLQGGALADEVEQEAWEVGTAATRLSLRPACLLRRNLDALYEAQDAIAEAIQKGQRGGVQ